MAKKSRSTMQQADAARHPDPARPDDPLIPNPAYPGADRPAQQQAASAKTRAMPGGGPSSSARRPAQQSAQAASSGQMSASPLGDPSPGDENPRDLPLPRATEDTAALMSEWRKHRRAGRKGKPQHMAQSSKRQGRQQSSGDASAFGDPSPGDENPRPLQPRGPQRT